MAQTPAPADIVDFSGFGVLMASDAAMNRRDFVRATAGAGLAAAVPMPPGADRIPISAPAVRRSAVRPLVIADASGIDFKNGGPECAVERAYRLITEGKDLLDALIAGVNIPELDPEETGIGYGALPNANGVVQLDASCMHGPRRRAGGVAAIEGVRTPSLVAQAVMDQTDHHLLAGKGAQDFALEDVRVMHGQGCRGADARTTAGGRSGGLTS